MNPSSLVIPVLLAAVAVYGTGLQGGCLRHTQPRRGRRPGHAGAHRTGAGRSPDGSFHVPGLRRHGVVCRTLQPCSGMAGHPAGDGAADADPSVSGSGALAVGTDLMAAYGPDSYIGGWRL